MKIYNVKVNGKTYKVELESIDVVASATPAAAPAPSAPKAAPAPAAAPAASGEGKEVPSPIQGSVVNVKVSVGQKVKKGDVLLVVEAMKLENDVVSPFDGEVSAVLVSKGQAVTAKQPLVVIK